MARQVSTWGLYYNVQHISNIFPVSGYTNPNKHSHNGAFHPESTQDFTTAGMSVLTWKQEVLAAGRHILPRQKNT